MQRLCCRRLEKHVRAAEAREEQEREARLEEAQAAAKKAKEYQAELEHRLQIQVGAGRLLMNCLAGLPVRLRCNIMLTVQAIEAQTCRGGCHRSFASSSPMRWLSTSALLTSYTENFRLGQRGPICMGCLADELVCGGSYVSNAQWSSACFHIGAPVQGLNPPGPGREQWNHDREHWGDLSEMWAKSHSFLQHSIFVPPERSC